MPQCHCVRIPPYQPSAPPATPRKEDPLQQALSDSSEGIYRRLRVLALLVLPIASMAAVRIGARWWSRPVELGGIERPCER